MPPDNFHIAQSFIEPCVAHELGEAGVSGSHQGGTSGVHQVNVDSGVTQQKFQGMPRPTIACLGP